MNKKIVIISMIITIIIITFLVIKYVNTTNEKDSGKEMYVEKDNSGNKINTSDKLKEIHIYEGLEIKNITLKANTEKVSTIDATIYNPTGEKKGNYRINIDVINKDGSIIETVVGYIVLVEPNTEETMNVVTMNDISHAYDIIIRAYSDS